MINFRPQADILRSGTADKHRTAAPKGLPYVSVEEAISESDLVLEKRLRRAPAIIRPYSSYLTASRGKGIRARAMVLAAMEEDNLVRGDAAVFAAAIELLHLATLVHDDVMDDAEYRRGAETLSKRSGTRVAVITGDYLLADVLVMMADAAEAGDLDELAKPAFLTRYMSRIAMGELRQTLLNGNYKITISDYLRIIAGKTAALFELSFLAGAILSANEERERNLYRKIGRYIGMIFQLTDDCLDYEGNLGDAGKNVQSDFEQRVVTLPLIYAMQENPDLQADILSDVADSEQVNTQVKESESLERTWRLAMKYKKKAAAAIDSLGCHSYKKDSLTEVLRMACRGK